VKNPQIDPGMIDVFRPTLYHIFDAAASSACGADNVNCQHIATSEFLAKKTSVK
jgi:hypothetical protein